MAQDEDMVVRQVLLVRHGETDYNLNGRWQGQLDTPLNDLGQSQAQALATHLKALKLDAIYSSDLMRAMETARPVAEARGLPIVADARLREIKLGAFQGLVRREIIELYPMEYDRWHHDNAYVVPDGESRLQLQARMLAAFTDITAAQQGETVMMVTHGGSIRWLLMGLFPAVSLEGKGIENTSVTTLTWEDGAWQLTEFAATHHLTLRHDSYTP